MSSFKENLRASREEAQQRTAEHELEQQKADEESKKTQTQLDALIKACAEEFVREDHLLSISTNKPQGGISIVYDSSVWNAPVFAVQSKTFGPTVTVEVSDGRWQEVSNYMGNWGAWSDLKTIYRGVLREDVVRQSLERAFLEWYKARFQ